MATRREIPQAVPPDYDCELLADAGLRLTQASIRMRRFLGREECRIRGNTDPTWILGHALNEEARRLLDSPQMSGAATLRESTLRSAYRLAAALDNLAAWTAPATEESASLNSYPAAASRDHVSYARYGCPETTAQELVYSQMLGFDPVAARLLLTSSGMAAYSLIENYLLRDVVRPGDRVLLHPGVYFETQLQLRALPFLDVRTARGSGRSDILQAIAERRPKVVFVDPLTNTMEFRAIDMLRLLNEADRILTQETWFVIDGTLLSGSFDPFALNQRRHVRVLYYESGCKYLQFGMDLGSAGVVVVEACLAERLLQLRRGVGAIASETLALPRTSRAAYLSYLSAQTACALATAAAVNAFKSGRQHARIHASHPRLPSHPDYDEVRGHSHLGGVFVLRFSRESLNRRVALEAFIETLMEKARLRKLPLTSGVSFGFRVPRIGAAWSSFAADHAFLRVSAGIDSENAGELGLLIGEHAHEWADEAAMA